MADGSDGVDISDDMASFQAAQDRDKANAATAALQSAAPQQPAQQGGFQHWFTDLPQNVGTGLLQAAVNTADAAHSAWKWVNEGEKDAAAKVGLTSQDQETHEIPTPEYSEVRGHVQDFINNTLAVKNPTVSDNVTQGIAQFAVPFLGWSKAVSAVGGASKLAGVGRLLFSEGATAATTQGPQDGRFADMVDLGRHTEGKFGQALQAISPDGSALNAYLDYMTNRTDEGEAEGRLKNVIDTWTQGALVSPLMMTGARMLKGGMEGLQYAIDNGVPSVDKLGISNQDGKIGYHGTPHDFDTAAGFDNDRIGSGEGNQIYGYGHYLAESPDVAGSYQTGLSQRGLHPDVVSAQADVAAAGGNKQKAFVTLTKQADNSSNPAEKMFLQRKAQLIKNGAADPRGSFVTADVPDEHIANMLDHDKPMSEQQHVLDKIPEADKAQMRTTLEEVDRNGNGSLEDLKGGQFRKLLEQTVAEGGISSPDMMDDHVPRQASAYLDSKGVPGITYLDGASRKGGEGTRNIVLFDGKKANVIAKNGKNVTKDPLAAEVEAAGRSVANK